MTQALTLYLIPGLMIVAGMSFIPEARAVCRRYRRVEVVGGLAFIAACWPAFLAMILHAAVTDDGGPT